MYQLIRKITALCFIIFFSIRMLLAQSTALPKIIPPNPVAQEFQRFLSYPVNGSTGAPDISIPVYDFKISGFEIPFSLKYNASGIKVEQTDGIVGYGWSLFPGMRITRTIMGKPDDYYYTDNLSSPDINDLNYLKDLSTAGIPGDDASTTHDGQYDIFTIHLPGANGSFIIRRENSAFTVVNIPDAPLKIIPLQNPGVSRQIYGFDVIDEKGVEYLFGPAGPTTNNGEEYLELSDSNVTGWMLRKILLPGQNNNIDLHYVSSSYASLLDGLSTSITIVDDNQTPPPSGEASAFNFMGLTDYGLHTVQNYPGTSYPPVFTTRSLSSLSAAAGTLEFTYGAQYGGDSNSDLQSIKVYDAAHTLIRSASFNKHDHLLTAFSPDGVAQYSFDYNPQRFTNRIGQDWWGYYNNDATPAFLIPRGYLEIKDYGSAPASQLLGYASREPDSVAMKANSLEKITYPTGGYFKLHYEAHRFNYLGMPKFGAGLRVYETESYDPVAGNRIVKLYKYGPNENGYGNLTGSFYPDISWFIDEKFAYGRIPVGHVDPGTPTRVRRCVLSSDSRFRFFGFNIPVWYDHVSEYSDGGKTATEYEYTADDYANDLHGYGPSDGFSSAAFRKPQLAPLQMFNVAIGSPALKKNSVYKNSGGSYTLIRETINNNAFAFQSVDGLIVQPLASLINGDGTELGNYYWTTGMNSFNSGGTTLQPFTHASYHIYAGINNLTTTTTTDYSGATPVINSSSFDYEPSGGHRYNKIQEQTTGSDGAQYTENYYYPTSSSIPNLTGTQQSVVGTLNTGNRLTALVEKTSRKNGVQTSAELYAYRDWGNNVLAPEIVYTSKGSAGFEPRLRYADYDNTTGNVLTVSKEHAPQVSYVWGYNRQYPIAQVTGAAAGEIYHNNFEESTDFPSGVQQDAGNVHTGHKAAMIVNPNSSELAYHSNTTLQISLGGQSRKFRYSGWFYSNGPTIEYWLFMKRAGETGYYTYLDNQYTAQTGGWVFLEKTFEVPADVTQLNLRVDNNGGGNIWFDDLRLYPADAQMSTYTYDPLIGQTSATDNRNQVSYYEYDAFGRLQYVRDDQRNILKAFCYNYQGQQTTCFTAGTTATTVYARAEISNVQYGNGYNPYFYTYSTGDIYIRFYSDPGCTQPYTLPAGVTVTLGTTNNYSDDYSSGGYSYNSDYNVPSGTSAFYAGNLYLHYAESSMDEYGYYHYNTDDYTYELIAHAGSDYIPQSTTTN